MVTSLSNCIFGWYYENFYTLGQWTIIKVAQEWGEVWLSFVKGENSYYAGAVGKKKKQLERNVQREVEELYTDSLKLFAAPEGHLHPGLKPAVLNHACLFHKGSQSQAGACHERQKKKAFYTSLETLWPHSPGQALDLGPIECLILGPMYFYTLV